MASSSAALNPTIFHDTRDSLPRGTNFSTLRHGFLNLSSNVSSNRSLSCERRFCAVRSVVRASAATVEPKVARDGTADEEGRILRVGLICGGPSAERGISLNSARSVLDHIQVFDFAVYYYTC